MKVIASGDITVGGFVESAQLESGGDITITGGIIGKKQDVESMAIADIVMSVVMTAKGNIFGKYCQYADIVCNNLRIENQLMHSLINVKESLWLGSEEKANGKLIAGYIRAGTSVHAGTVGATAGSVTIVTFEDRLNLLNEAMSEIDTRLEIESKKTAELKVASTKLKKLPKDKVKPEMLSKVISTYKYHANRMGGVLNEKEALDEEIKLYMASVFIEATDKIYKGVQLIVG